MENINQNYNLKKGDKVLINPNVIKNQMDKHEQLLRISLGKHFNKEIHMKGINTELYDRALRGEEATITWVERSSNDSAMVNINFIDGFECSATKTSILNKI